MEIVNFLKYKQVLLYQLIIISCLSFYKVAAGSGSRRSSKLSKISANEKQAFMV